MTLTSQASISSGSAGRPMPSFSAMAGAARAEKMAAPIRRSRYFDILCLPVRLDPPSLNSIVVIDRVEPANLAKLVLRRLHVAGLVDGPRLQQHFRTVPDVVEMEPRERHRLRLACKPRLLPA